MNRFIQIRIIGVCCCSKLGIQFGFANFLLNKSLVSRRVVLALEFDQLLIGGKEFFVVDVF
ncbi:hypothetical protein DAA61_39400 [Bradyrhizobium sp. WBAH33]|nr:hypothetical protein DAA61_39400 [Bradyrhizobium sp. WBAH33]